MRTPRTLPRATLTRSKAEKAQEAQALQTWEDQGRLMATEDQVEMAVQAAGISELHAWRCSPIGLLIFQDREPDQVDSLESLLLILGDVLDLRPEHFNWARCISRTVP
jgi:hypothetical protein